MYIFVSFVLPHQAPPLNELRRRALVVLWAESKAEVAVIWESGMGTTPFTKASSVTQVGSVGAVEGNVLTFFMISISYYRHDRCLCFCANIKLCGQISKLNNEWLKLFLTNQYFDKSLYILRLKGGIFFFLSTSL